MCSFQLCFLDRSCQSLLRTVGVFFLHSDKMAVSTPSLSSFVDTPAEKENTQDEPCPLTSLAWATWSGQMRPSPSTFYSPVRAQEALYQRPCHQSPQQEGLNCSFSNHLQMQPAHNTTKDSRHKGSWRKLGKLFILLARFRNIWTRGESPAWWLLHILLLRFPGLWTYQWASNACSSMGPRAWALIFENEWRLHLVGHVLPHKCFHNGQRKLKAGPWPTAGEDQAVLLHSAL